MKNFLIPISVRLNSLTDDVVTVGLLAFNDNCRYFDFSSEKMRLANLFLDSNSKAYLEKAFKLLKANFLSGEKIFNLPFPNLLLEEKYFDYLTKYSNGIIKFGEPKGFAMKLDEETFYKVFKNFVGAEPGKNVQTSTSLRREMGIFLKAKVFDKVDVNFAIDPSLIPGIYAPHKLDFIGINGSPYAGLGIDFKKGAVEVDKTILTFKSIANGLAGISEKLKMSRGTYELYFNEPESKENKSLLDKVKKDKSKGFELLEFDKIDRVIKKLNLGDYKKFSESRLVDKI